MNHLGTVDKGQFRQGEDPIAIEGWLEGKVKTGQGLDGGQPGHLQGSLNPAALANRQLFEQQLIEGFDAIDVTLLDLSERRVKHFEGAGHP